MFRKNHDHVKVEWGVYYVRDKIQCMMTACLSLSAGWAHYAEMCSHDQKRESNMCYMCWESY